LYKNLHRLQESTVYPDNYVEDYFEEWGDRTSSLCVNFRRTKWKQPVYEKCRFIRDIAQYFPNVSIICSILEYLPSKTFAGWASETGRCQQTGCAKYSGKIPRNLNSMSPRIRRRCEKGRDETCHRLCRAICRSLWPPTTAVDTLRFPMFLLHAENGCMACKTVRTPEDDWMVEIDQIHLY